MATWHFENLRDRVSGTPDPQGGLAAYVWDGDPNGSSFHVVYVGDDDYHLHELYTIKGWNGWAHNDITNAANAPRVLGGSTPFGYVWERDPSGSSQHVVYVGEDLHVHELWNRPGGWHHNDLYNASGASAGALIKAGCQPYAYVWDNDAAGPGQHVVFVGGDLHIHEFYYCQGRWSHNDLHSRSGCLHLAGSVSCSGYVWGRDSYGSSQHVIWTCSLDSHVHEFSVNQREHWWHDRDVTNSAAGAPAGLLGATPYGYAWDRDPTSPSQHIVYQGQDSHIHELWFSVATGQFTHADLTNNTGAPTTISTPYGWAWDTDPAGPSQNVLFKAYAGIAAPTLLSKVHLLSFTSSNRKFTDTDITAAAQMTPQIEPSDPGKGLAWNQTGGQHIVYTSALVNHYWTTG